MKIWRWAKSMKSGRLRKMVRLKVGDQNIDFHIKQNVISYIVNLPKKYSNYLKHVCHANHWKAGWNNSEILLG